ncbi:MAG: molybdopterin-guanine dinucleotide biosynthesis protein MobA [Gammaproteobacteria bacterium]|nr:molybdopterin-guanine dinucleotide biosynthesis protein MobA [Gammaproteobacteria bacterium]|tara:strand:+ start:892 stop:1470 length:579 start_codon:yes stop_codon:yes gene_type:complete
MTIKVGAILLAAGFSNRFGSLKLCAELNDGSTVFEQTLRRIHSSIPEYKVVTRPEIAHQLSSVGTELNIFHDAEKGMGSTIAFGISLIDDWDACLICLADMPFIQGDTYRRLATELTNENIVSPFYKQQAGNPIGFGSKFFPELAQLRGDSGGKQIVRAHKTAVVRVNITEPAILYDIDIPADLDRFQTLSS